MQAKGKTARITGASSGIGRDLAIDLSRRGPRLILSSRSEEGLRACRRACENQDRHMVLTLDLSDPASLAEGAQRALQESGPTTWKEWVEGYGSAPADPRSPQPEWAGPRLP